MLVFLGLQETMMSLPTHLCFLPFFLHLQKKITSQDPNSSSSFVIFLQSQKTTKTSFLACHCLFVFFSLVTEYDDELGSQFIIILCCFSLDAEDDNKPPNSLSSSTFFSSIVKDNDEPLDSLSSLGFLLQLQTMMTSQDPNSSLSLVVLQKMTMSFLV